MYKNLETNLQEKKNKNDTKKNLDKHCFFFPQITFFSLSRPAVRARRESSTVSSVNVVV